MVKSKRSTKERKNISITLPSDPKTLKALKEVCQAQVAKYKTIKNTKDAYNGYIGRGRKFLEGLIVQRKANGEGEVCMDGIQTAELEKALDGLPNRHSAQVLELFLIQKCFVEDRGVSTADGIHGAFCELWDSMDGNRYAGAYECNEETGEVRGCPARAQCVLDVVKSVKIWAKADGSSATRNHADAMTLEEIQKLMRWSMSVCPDEKLTEDPKGITDTADLVFRLEHGLMHAFMSSAFTLWTRCFELLSLQAQDARTDCCGLAPYYAPHFKIYLNHRKGWQQEKGYEGRRESNVYDIYQQDIDEIDMYTHFNRWRNLLEGYLGEKLSGEDSFFPHLSPNGVIRTTRAMSYDSLQTLLVRFCKSAGVDKRYTTHSFRRGGAQYRFMSAPIGKRWSLNQIRWWGGWAVGENVDTLIKYLVDSLQSFETGFGHLLHPIPIQPDMSFMGDHTAVAAVTAEEFRQFGNAINRKFDEIVTLVTSAPPLSIPHSNAMNVDQPCPTERLVYPRPLYFEDGIGGIHQASGTCRDLAAPPCWVETSAPAAYSKSGQGHSNVTQGTPYQLANSEVLLSPPPLFPKVSITPLGRAVGAWRRAIKQWEEVDPVTGKALKDWPPEWYNGEQRLKVASSRRQREVIFEEFVR
ncbi:hypothetical protein CPB84DRAFT_1677144 [Gymnopilus junonius]|uniref:Tyr recombinase domain-containing protein n=1 Tax=Gymnopilus junonius TaxID=109634 RepID=A0A9P5TQE9_GYMJU|nr:hypothetical protein CPB84DRAFT_1677144 [Gymnopilus junonius]